MCEATVGFGEIQVRRRRLLALGLVLVVSFAHFVVASLSYLLGAEPPHGLYQNQFRLLGGIVSESTSLLLLWYVLSQQGRDWKDIGWKPQWVDVFHGLGLAFVGFVTTVFTEATFQLSYGSFTGHYLQPKRVETLLGFGISALSVVLVILNPFFEELIVRGYAMSELMDLGFAPGLAVVISVAIQVSYHLYQGLPRVLGVTATFIVFSLYFSKTRRIAPVVLAHFCFDAYALVRLSH
jgi:membrane protease YdiL (CAAX protease family)